MLRATYHSQSPVADDLDLAVVRRLPIKQYRAPDFCRVGMCR